MAIASDTATLVKPMQTLLGRLDEHLQEAVARCEQQSRALRVAIVGGGAAGVEIAFCLQRRLQIDFPGNDAELTVIDGHDTVLASERESTQRRATRLLADRGIRLSLNNRVAAVSNDSVRLESGKELPADLVIWAAGAAPPKLLAEIDLPNDDAGFLLTRHTLQSTADARVFAVGDTGTIEHEPYAKAGVYAVRQGPVLWHNLQAMLHDRPLREFHPQKAFLRLLNTADGRAILDYHGLVVHARWCWWLKDWIDRSFVGKYQRSR
jgi:selenide,water dikinase